MLTPKNSGDNLNIAVLIMLNPSSSQTVEPTCRATEKDKTPLYLEDIQSIQNSFSLTEDKENKFSLNPLMSTDNALVLNIDWEKRDQVCQAQDNWPTAFIDALLQWVILLRWPHGEPVCPENDIPWCELEIVFIALHVHCTFPELRSVGSLLGTLQNTSRLCIMSLPLWDGTLAPYNFFQNACSQTGHGHAFRILCQGFVSAQVRIFCSEVPAVTCRWPQCCTLASEHADQHKANTERFVLYVDDIKFVVKHLDVLESATSFAFVRPRP